MADYAPLITRAVDALPDNTAEARRNIYERARGALTKQLRSIEPPLSEDDIAREQKSLEDAIRRIETDAGAKESIAAALGSLDFSQLEKPAAPVTKAVVPDAEKPAEEAPLSTEEAREALAESVAAVTNQEPIEPHVFEGEAQKLPASAKESEELAAPKIVPSSVAAASIAASGQIAAQAKGLQPHPNAAEAATENGKEPQLQPLRPVSRPEAGFGLQKKKRGGVVVPLIAVLLLLGAIGGGYWMWMKRQAEMQTASAPQAQVPPHPGEAEKPKSSDRIAQSEAPAVQNPPQPAKPAETAPATPAAPQATQDTERVTLLEEAPVSQQSETLTGTVTWRNESLSAGTGQPPDIAIRADVEIPQRRMMVTLTIRRNTDATLPASHTIEVMFKLPRDFPYGGIANVPGLLAKANEQGRGMPLVGQSVRVMNGFFFIGLSSAEADRAGNVQMLKERQWIDIPIEYDNRRRAILSIDKGVSGQKAVDSAFKAWGE